MNLSMRWLKEFVDLDVPTRQYAADMTMSGSKVEGYAVEGSEITNVVVGKCLSVEKHPNADTLVICKIDVGEGEPLQIVTGATNMFPGAYIPVAKDGSTIAGGKEIHKGQLRGAESNGMLCSLAELGLTQHDFPNAIENGIMILDQEYPLGMDIHEALGLNDTCVEFEITPNRPDCLSVIGLARETAATYRLPLKLHTPVVKGGGGPVSDYLKVDVENTKLCKRYIGRMVKDIKIQPSPRWMRERLRASGVRPINNIVDITNYVMLEYGQPMHAFDYRHVKDGHIIVRNAKEGEVITTLDGVERKLSPEMLLICDPDGPSAIAGVMGGEYSGIYDDTQMIVFESACFDNVSVRTTSRKVGLRTEASGRYEKGLDSRNCLPAVERACELVELLGAGTVLDGMVDVDNDQKAPNRIPFQVDWINRFLGIQVSRQEMEAILKPLDIVVDGGELIPPSYRADLEGKADIAEEIARFYGYNKIPTTAITGVAEARLTPGQKFERTAVDTLLAQGLYEVMTYSFVSPKVYDKIRLPKESPLRKSVVIGNPLGEDTSIMRTTVLPSMLEVLSRNYNNRNLSAACFELGNEYLPVDGQELPDERTQAVIGMYGDGVDFYQLKGVVETLLEALNVTGWEIQPQTQDPTFHPGRCAQVVCGQEVLGILGEVHPLVLQNYELGTKAYLAKLDMGRMMAHVGPEKSYHPLPKYPATTRDLAILCDEDLPVLTMEKAIRGAVGDILEQVEIFDVYRGKQIPAGKKSVAYSLVLRAEDRTLTDEETDRAVAGALQALSELGAQLRS